MKVFNILAAFVVLLWAQSAAAVAYCPPEYQSCEGTGTPGGTWGGGDPTVPRDGYKQYGYPYSQCSTGPNMVARCWECVWNPNKRTEVCGGVSHTASCGCYEQYSNYIIIDCWSSGSCQYQGQ